MDRRTVVALFFLLLLVCVGLIVLSQFSGPVLREQLLPVALDGFKMVLGAIVGALSALMGVKANETSKKANEPSQ
ncbi:MAG: hypothetical protein KI785_11900 [Devosiaceae bacterium]|nr:hypothetical protein [Devosiaceae bacterium MH13]